MPTASPLHDRRLRAWLCTVVMVAAVVFSLPWRFLETLEYAAIDLRYHLCASSEGDSPIVVLGVGDSAFSLAERAPGEVAANPVLASMSRDWPWDRSVFAAVVEKLHEAGARAVVFDLVFASPSAADDRFAQALSGASMPVVLASVIQEQHSPEGEATVSLLEPRRSLAEAAPNVRVGFANIEPDFDGIVRRTAVAVAPEALLRGIEADNGPADSAAISSLTAAACSALGGPAPRPGAHYVGFRHPPAWFPLLPIENLFLADRWNGPVIAHGDLFKGKVVFVGPTSEVRFKDFHTTPYGRIPGVVLQAEFLDSLLSGGLLRRPGQGATAACVVGLSLAALATGLFVRRAALQAAAFAALPALWLATAWLAFAKSGVLLPVVPPLGALAFCGLALPSLRYLAEERERRRLRRLLGSYVSEPVARLIARNPGDFESALSGTRKPVTALFADIRGFTTWSEEAVPEALIAQLNEYLQAAVECVQETGGTLQKFIGDAVFAVWGDTHSLGERVDAERAVAAAVEIEAALGRLNARWEGRADRTPLRIGIGLHQGPAMVGNIGHARRMEFAVLGDTVNLAARLEGANRHFGTTVLVTASVRALAAESFDFLPVARIKVKGRRQSVDVYTPTGPRAPVRSAWVEAYENAYESLMAGRFVEALHGFENLPAADARLAGLVASQILHASRLASASHTAWDGTHDLEKS